MVKGALPLDINSIGTKTDPMFDLDWHYKDLIAFVGADKIDSAYLIKQSDLAQALRDAFEAGREGDGLWGCFEKWKSADDYLKSLTQSA
jgi:hypothetical protein